MRTRIPKLIAEINTVIADHSRSDSKEEQEAIDLLKQRRMSDSAFAQVLLARRHCK